MRVGEIMRTEVIVLKPEMTVRQAVTIFAENGIGGAPVVDDDNKVVGILTNADVFRGLGLKYKKLNIAFPTMGMGMATVDFKSSVQYKDLRKAFKEISETEVRSLMVSKVFTVKPTEHVEVVVPDLLEKRINRLPVVDDGRLVGILSRRDIIKALLLI